MVSWVTGATVKGDTASGVDVVVADGAVCADAEPAVAVGAPSDGAAFDEAADAPVTSVGVVVESSPQPLTISTAANAAMTLRARRIITSS